MGQLSTHVTLDKTKRAIARQGRKEAKRLQVLGVSLSSLSLTWKKRGQGLRAEGAHSLTSQDADY